MPRVNKAVRTPSDYSLRQAEPPSASYDQLGPNLAANVSCLQDQHKFYPSTRSISTDRVLSRYHVIPKSSDYGQNPTANATDVIDASNPSDHPRKATIFSIFQWGIDEMRKLRHRGFRDMHFDKGWCKKNVCKDTGKLNALCHKTSLSIIEKKECDWCLPRDEEAVDRHCNIVSSCAVIALFGVCGLLCVLVIILLAVFRLRAHRGGQMPRDCATFSDAKFHRRSSAG